jgi:hypothetical protein
MVTICACALALIAFAILFHCESSAYQQTQQAGESIEQPWVASDVTLSKEQQLSELSDKYEIPRQDVVGFWPKIKAILHFTHFVFFSSNESKQELIRRNELTAEMLIGEYQDFTMLPAEQRVDRFIRWRDDLAYFEANKSAFCSVKSSVIELRGR